jgi:hypothetical protein
MKKWLLMFLLMTATDLLALCKDGRTLRVRFQQCAIQDETVDIRLGGDPSAITLAKVSDGVYEKELPGPIGTNLSIEIDGDPPICCAPKAELVREAPPSIDCDVVYLVYCDLPQPSWAVRAPLRRDGVTFELAPGHPARFKDTCSPLEVATTGDGWLSRLRSRDMVKVEVYSRNQWVLRFAVKLKDFTSSRLVKSSEELLDMIDPLKTRLQNSRERKLSEQEQSLIDLRVSLVPRDGVIVEKR